MIKEKVVWIVTKVVAPARSFGSDFSAFQCIHTNYSKLLKNCRIPPNAKIFFEFFLKIFVIGFQIFLPIPVSNLTLRSLGREKSTNPLVFLFSLPLTHTPYWFVFLLFSSVSCLVRVLVPLRHGRLDRQSVGETDRARLARWLPYRLIQFQLVGRRNWRHSVGSAAGLGWLVHAWQLDLWLRDVGPFHGGIPCSDFSAALATGDKFIIVIRDEKC